jgi:uncharacterized metal-binding protein
MKVCRCCKIEKDLKDFSKNKVTKDGFQNICKPCLKEKVLAKHTNYNLDKVKPIYKDINYYNNIYNNL